jgi:RND family efflux transporter MFP subunit
MVYVKAPISGTITQINVRPTENVRPGMPLFTVSNQSGFEARFYVGVEEIERIQVGARTFISHRKRTDANIEGRIVQVSQMMDTQKPACPVTAFFDGGAHTLVSGISVDIAVETYRNEKAIVLSRRELVDTETGLAAFIAEGNRVRKVEVVTGAEKDLRFEILNGLQDGDTIISEGVQRINANSMINVVPAVLSGTR